MKHTRKVVVITGASAGIGYATAMEFAKQGYDIGLISRNEARLKTLKKNLEVLNVRADYFVADVADFGKMKKAAEYFEDHLGAIDVWVNNAMVSVFSPIKKMQAEEFKRVTEVTYLGIVYGTLVALKKMLPRNRGVIVQVGSALAYRGIPLQSAYCAAKHAVLGFHDSLRSELLHDRSAVHVTMVQLPALNTPQFEWSKSRMKHKAQPVPPIFQPEVAASAIFWAATHTRREVSVGFPVFKAIWANKFFPGWLDTLLARTGYSSQQTEEKEDPAKRDNLFESVEGTYKAHGRFDRQAKNFSMHFWLNKSLKSIGVVSMVLGLLSILLFCTHDRRRTEKKY